jgi:hypothetical protein
MKIIGMILVTIFAIGAAGCDGHGVRSRDVASVYTPAPTTPGGGDGHGN